MTSPLSTVSVEDYVSKVPRPRAGCGQSPFSAAAQCARLQGLMNPGPANLASVKCQKKELLKKVDVDIQIFLGSNYLVRPLLRKGLRPASEVFDTVLMIVVFSLQTLLLDSIQQQSRLNCTGCDLSDVLFLQGHRLFSSGCLHSVCGKRKQSGH